MFAKLLKHEWRATRGVIGLLCIIILICGITIGGVMHYMLQAEMQQGAHVAAEGLHVVVESEESAISDGVLILCILLLAAGISAIAVCGAASVFVVTYRFFKRCFTDEGYLTFTLPVTNHQILLSSMLNSICGVFTVVLACFAAVAIAFGFFLTAINQEIIWADVWVSWADVWQQLVDSFRKNHDLFALVGFSGIMGALSELILLMTAVTIGALVAKKHKILAAVGVYYGIGIIQSFFYSVFAFSAVSTENVNLVLAIPGIAGLILAVGGYFLMHWLTSKKLNLT